MIGTASLRQLVDLAERHGWRMVLVGDPRQLQAVGRGGLFNELCRTSRVHELSHIHRFREHWEAAAFLKLRSGNPSALDAYEAHDRITAGCFDEHVDRIAKEWLRLTTAGQAVVITASTNQHLDVLNTAVQHARLTVGQLDPDTVVRIAGSEHAYRGELIVTRHNDRELRTGTGEPVRNRDLWTVPGRRSPGGCQRSSASTATPRKSTSSTSPRRSMCAARSWTTSPEPSVSTATRSAPCSSRPDSAPPRIMRWCRCWR
jgi:ATP-dependent exoDNAse (exonuclease V) alpha subunit